MKRADEKTIALCFKLLNEECEENRYRDQEIMQGIDGEKNHALDVYGWVQKIEKNASITLQIAALFHDIDRIITPGVGAGFKGDRTSKEYSKHKKAHANRSANYICPLLLKNGLSKSFIDRVRFLIQHHDDTGKEIEFINDRELDILVSADSLSFFDTIVTTLYKEEGEERLKDKVRFMIQKMPKLGKRLLESQTLGNKIFEKIKREVLSEM